MKKEKYSKRDVVIVFVHGINVTSQDYYVPMRDALLRSLPRADRPYVIFRAVFWADLLRGRQQEYLLYASTQCRFKPTRLHKMVIEGLGDAAAYQKSEFRNSAYYDIQSRLRKTIADGSTGPGDRRPLFFVGHSLGCHIVSSYAWDMHKLKHKVRMNPGTDVFADASMRAFDVWKDHDWKSPFECLDTFAGFVSMGSNQPLFTFNIGAQFVHPITRAQDAATKPAFPGEALDASVKSQARYLNFYSWNDPLGYPLKPLNDAFDDEPLLTDIHTFSEGYVRSFFLRGWLRQLIGIRAHSGYWTNRKVLRHTAALLSNIINADELAARESRRMAKAAPPVAAA